MDFLKVFFIYPVDLSKDFLGLFLKMSSAFPSEYHKFGIQSKIFPEFSYITYTRDYTKDSFKMKAFQWKSVEVLNER